MAAEESNGEGAGTGRFPLFGGGLAREPEGSRERSQFKLRQQFELGEQ